MKRIVSAALALFLLCSFSVGLADSLSSMNAMALTASYAAWAKYYEIPDFNDEMQTSIDGDTGSIQIDALAVNYNRSTYEVEQAIILYSMEGVSMEWDARAIAFYSAVESPTIPDSASKAAEVKKEAEAFLGRVRASIPALNEAGEEELVMFNLTGTCAYSFFKSEGYVAIVAN